MADKDHDDYNAYKDEYKIYKNESKVINFTFFVACSDPQSAANFLYSVLKEEGKEKIFPILKEKVVKLLEREQYNQEAALLRTIKIEKK